MNKRAPEENVQLRRVLELGGLEVVKATYRYHHFPKHSHDVFAFGIVERGVQGTEHRGTTHIAVAGEVCLVNPGEVHTGYTTDEGGWSYRCCYPDVGLISEIAYQDSDRTWGQPYFPSPVIRDPVVYDRFRRLFNEIEDCQHIMSLQEKLVAAISALLERHGVHRRPPPRHHDGDVSPIKRAYDYIEEHWADQIRLEDVAAAAGIDCFTLIRTFRKRVGMTPHAYLMQRRIDKGKGLLLSGHSPAQAALDTGFFDQSHFTKQFKRYTGVTPGHYIRSLGRPQGGRVS
ncbi:MAG TPA: AraC family transcriptional regulator [Deltaproteobacteria bacterium]|nr:AraC family transcriptional regulator [Deltaproteobacteria bacterium]